MKVLREVLALQKHEPARKLPREKIRLPEDGGSAAKGGLASVQRVGVGRRGGMASLFRRRLRKWANPPNTSLH